MVECGFQAVILLLTMMDGNAGLGGHTVEDTRQVHALGLPMRYGFGHIELVYPANHLIDGLEAQLRHDLAQLFGYEEEIVDHVLGLAGEALAQNRILGRNSHRAGIEMAFAHHDAARRDQGRGGKTEFVGAQKRSDSHVAAGAQSAIDLNRDAAAQSVQHQSLLGLGKADFPGTAGMGERGERGSAGAAFKARNRHMVGAAFGDAGRNRAHTHFRHQLDRNARLAVDAFEVADQLRQIFDGIDVVMRRRRDQAHARRGMAHLGDIGVHLVARQLAAFAGLGALRHLDLDVVGIDQIFGGDAEAARRHLLDRRAHGIAIGQRLEAVGLFAAFAGVGAPADAVHGDGKIGMGLAADRAEAHRAGGEALDDLDRRFDLIERHTGAVGLELHQPAQSEQTLALLVDLLGEKLIFGRVVAAHRMLQPRTDIRRPCMIFAAQTKCIIATHIQHIAIDGNIAKASL